MAKLECHRGAVTGDLEADPYADWPDRTPMYDGDGRLALVFTLSEATRSGRPWADGAWRPGSMPAVRCRDLVLQAMPGYALSTADRALADALLDAGASQIRHAHAMSHRLSSSIPDPRSNPDVTLEQLSSGQLLAHADELGEISYRAYPPSHPDHEHAEVGDAIRELREIALGQILGPYLEVSQVARFGGRPVGACLIVDRDGSPPDGGPWVVDIFRDPDITISGIGRALLSAALLAASKAGLPGLSLAVSHENSNALGLYTSLGFMDAGESVTVAIPG